MLLQKTWKNSRCDFWKEKKIAVICFYFFVKGKTECKIASWTLLHTACDKYNVFFAVLHHEHFWRMTLYIRGAETFEYKGTKLDRGAKSQM